MTKNKTASQLAKEAQKREAERKCNATKKWEFAKTFFALIGVISVILFILIGSGTWAILLSDKIVIIVISLSIFLFALAGFFNDKLKGYGPFNTSTLLIILALMVAMIVFLIDKDTSDDIVKIIFAVIGFAAGLFAGKGADKDKKTTPPENNRENDRSNH